MSRLNFAGELESAADQIADISRADLQIVLRRAALMLRNVAGVDLGARTDELLFWSRSGDGGFQVRFDQKRSSAIGLLPSLSA